MIPQKPSSHQERATLSIHAVVGRVAVVVRALVPTLLVSIEASSVEVVRGSGRPFPLDRTACVIVPSGMSVTIRSSGSAARVAGIGFERALFELAERTYERLGFDRKRLERWLERLEQLPRTVWVHEIVHRYVFERNALGEHDNTATLFLETEILKEIYFLFRDRDEGADRATVVRKLGRCVERAIAYIEAHLFEPRSVAELAAYAGASESTLLRTFRRELGCTPASYWRMRRLDEALVLLRAGRYSVSEVAATVGYDNPTVFAHAFRLRYGRPPSEFQPRRPVRRAP